MPPTGTPPAAITPQGVRDGAPAVLAALATRRGPAVLAFAGEVVEPSYVVRAAADAFARFRAEVADPAGSVDAHPDALLLRAARRAVLDLVTRGPDLGCGPAAALLIARAERTIMARDEALLERHLESCDHCRDVADRLAVADRAYREAEETPLEPSTLAPLVAALAAAAPVRLEPPPALPEPAVRPSGRIAPTTPHGVDDPPASEGPTAEEEEPPPAEEESEPAAAEEAADEPVEAPSGTKRVTGAPSSYYELPAPPPRERGRRAKRAARGAAVAGGAAASLTRRAGAAARKRIDRPADDTPETPDAADDTRTWQAIDSIEFPAQTLTPAPAADTPEYEPTPMPEPELQESAARAAARHYRRSRHSKQKQEAAPADGKPPRLARPVRDRGPRLPLTAHGPRDLALPAGLLVIAVLVIMAVSGVFGGGAETPNTGTSATSPPEVSLVSQSATSISLDDAEEIAARVAGTTAP